MCCFLTAGGRKPPPLRGDNNIVAARILAMRSQRPGALSMAKKEDKLAERTCDDYATGA